MVHEIGPVLRTATLHQAYGVYKDYDGNSPDSGFFAVCATKELAKEVADLLNKHDPNSRNDDDEEDGEEDEDKEKPNEGVIVKTEAIEEEKTLKANVDSIGWPGCDGWEWSACWQTQTTEAERSKIATTLAEAIKQVVGS